MAQVAHQVYEHDARVERPGALGAVEGVVVMAPDDRLQRQFLGLLKDHIRCARGGMRLVVIDLDDRVGD